MRRFAPIEMPVPTDRHRPNAVIAISEIRTSSIGCVAGVVLEDGRRVVVKAHQPDKMTRPISMPRTVFVGYPCPKHDRTRYPAVLLL